jgi:N-acetylglutamate synthase-like GNAT family acetyltransferase
LVFLVEDENGVQSQLEAGVDLSEEVTIRDARPEDAFAIHQVLRNAFEPLVSRGYSKIAVKSAIVKPWQIRKRIISGLAVLVAEDGSDIIGTITGIKRRQTMEAVSFAVHPEYQNRGIGGELLTALEYLAIEDDCNKIYALTAWPMIEASCLYLHLGYVQEGYLRCHYHGEDLVVFSKHFSHEDDAKWSSLNLKCEAIQYSWPYWLF